MKRSAILLIAVSGLIAPCGAQTTRLVPSQYSTVQAAITASANGDTVQVAPGTYSGAVNFVGKTITVTSSGGASATTLTAGSASTVVTFQGGEGAACVLNGFTISNAGGGILCQNASPQITNCVITGHTKASTLSGGGIRCVSTGAFVCSPSINGCTISNNVAGFGAGFSFEGGSAIFSYPTITNCVISGNVGISQVTGGGGAYVNGMTTSATFTATRITGNTSWYAEGAINAPTLAVLAMSRCRIDHNTGPSPGIVGGILQATFTGCIVTDNFGHGATLTLWNPTSNPPSASFTFQCCTITANTDTNGALGGIYATSGPSVMTCSNSIVWGNTGLNIYATNGNATSNVTYCDVGPGVFTGSSNISADPGFVDSANGDYHIASLSPCVNGGNPSPAGLPATDIDGITRVQGGIVDIGADEIPVLAMPGTADGLDLFATINGAGDPLASTRAGSTGSHLAVLLKSATPALVGGVPIFGAEVYVNGSPPTPIAPGIWLDYGATIVYGAASPPPFGFPGIPAEGLSFDFVVPAGLAGHAVRMQGFVFTVNALNGSVAQSNATEVTF